MRVAAASAGPYMPLGSPAPLRLALALEAERDRWFCWVPVLLGLGVALYFALPEEPPLAAAPAPLAVALVVKAAWRRGSAAAVLTGACLATGLGFALAKLRVESVRAPVLERTLYGAEVRGFVELIEPRAKRGQRLTVLVTSLGDLEPARRPHRVRIRTMTALEGLKPGDAVKVRATLGPPAKPALPGGFDFARTAFFQKLGGIGYTLTRPQIDAEAGKPPSHLEATAAIERVRQRIGARVAAALPGETGAIASALIVGERGGISTATNDAFRDSGLLHILSISGLHMVIMAGSVFYAVRLALAAIPGLALRFPIKKWAAVAATFAAFGYLMISGSSFATVRAAIMISIMFLAVILDRPALALRNVAIAAILILLFVPESLTDVGFQMSFAAVVGLVSAYEWVRTRAERRSGRRSPVLVAALFFGGIVLSTLVASAAVAPFAAYHFHKSQQYAVLANLIAVPIVNIIVMPAALAALVLMPFGLEGAALWAMGMGIEGMAWCARLVATLPGAVGRIPAMPTFAFALMVSGGLWLALWRARWRLLGLGAVAAGIALAPALQRPDILVGRDGALVAIRDGTGVLSALPARRATFELSRWLAADGDARLPADVAKAAGFLCDGIGCTASVKDLIVAVAHRPPALTDDCRRARILVLSIPRPAGCNGPTAVLDLFSLRDGGTHAIYVEGADRLRIETVAGWRGDRPWSHATSRQKGAMPRVEVPTQSKTRPPSGVGSFAAPPEFAQGAGPRPEIEDEDEDSSGDLGAAQ